jgi:hypothetical protein
MWHKKAHKFGARLGWGTNSGKVQRLSAAQAACAAGSLRARNATLPESAPPERREGRMLEAPGDSGIRSPPVRTGTGTGTGRLDVIQLIALVGAVSVLIEVKVVVAKVLTFEHLGTRVDLDRVGQLAVGLEATRLVTIVFEDDVRPVGERAVIIVAVRGVMLDFPRALCERTERGRDMGAGAGRQARALLILELSQA